MVDCVGAALHQASMGDHRGQDAGPLPLGSPGQQGTAEWHGGLGASPVCAEKSNLLYGVEYRVGNVERVGKVLKDE